MFTKRSFWVARIRTTWWLQHAGTRQAAFQGRFVHVSRLAFVKRSSLHMSRCRDDVFSSATKLGNTEQNHLCLYLCMPKTFFLSKNACWTENVNPYRQFFWYKTLAFSSGNFCSARATTLTFMHMVWKNRRIHACHAILSCTAFCTKR